MKARVKVVAVAALAAVLGGVGCAGGKEATKDVQAITPGWSQTRMGVVSSVQGDQIEVRSVDQPTDPPAWFAISTDTEVVRAGVPVGMEALSEGTPVRVQFEPATGPEKTRKVEVLTGETGESVKERARELEGQPAPMP